MKIKPGDIISCPKYPHEKLEVMKVDSLGRVLLARENGVRFKHVFHVSELECFGYEVVETKEERNDT
jgi:hypothetical protein